MSASHFALRVLLAINFTAGDGLMSSWYTLFRGKHRIEFLYSKCQQHCHSLAQHADGWIVSWPHIRDVNDEVFFFFCGNQSWQPGLKSMLLQQQIVHLHATLHLDFAPFHRCCHKKISNFDFVYIFKNLGVLFMQSRLVRNQLMFCTARTRQQKAQLFFLDENTIHAIFFFLIRLGAV